MLADFSGDATACWSVGQGGPGTGPRGGVRPPNVAVRLVHANRSVTKSQLPPAAPAKAITGKT